MTEYTPTEPEIEKALAFLTNAVLRVPDYSSFTRSDAADGVTLAAVDAELKLVDRAGFDPAEQVRAARAAIEARRRWAERETKAA